MVQGDNEPCMFRNPDTGIIVCLYVDDLLCRGTDKVSGEFHKQLEDRFECREPPAYLNVGQPLEFLGFRVVMEESGVGTEVHMDQQEAVTAFLERQPLGKLKDRTCPMPSLKKLFSDMEACNDATAAECKHLIGLLNFLAKVV